MKKEQYQNNINKENYPLIKTILKQARRVSDKWKLGQYIEKEDNDNTKINNKKGKWDV